MRISRVTEEPGRRRLNGSNSSDYTFYRRGNEIMATITAGDFRNGMTFEYDAQGRLKRSSYVTPGASAAVTRSYTYGLIYVPGAEG